MRHLFTGLTALLLLAPPLAGQQVGDRIVVTADSAPLRQPGVVTGNVSKGTALEVEQVNGDWLWVTHDADVVAVKGWISRREVRLESELLQGLTRELLSEPTAARYQERGRLRLGRGEYRQAIEDFTAALKIDDSAAASFYSRGMAYRGLSDFQAAIADFGSAIQRDDSDPNPYNQRGISYFDLGQFDSAIADYSAAIRLAPEASILFNNRGNAWYKKGQFADALTDYDDAIRLAPNDPLPYKNRGTVRSESQDPRGALADFEKAIALATDDARVLNSFAWFLATDPSARDPARAVELAKRACELSQWTDWVPIDTLAVAAAAAGQWADAARFQSLAIELGPESAQAEMAQRVAEYRSKQSAAPSVAAAAPATRQPEAVKPESRPSQGVLRIGERAYDLVHVVAYRAKMFEDEEEPATIVLAVAAPLSARHLAALKQSIAKDGTDYGLHLRSPYVKLSFDEYGGLIHFHGWADNFSLNGGSRIDASCEEAGGRVSGRAATRQPQEFFDTTYQFQVTFDAELVASASPPAATEPAAVPLAEQPPAAERPFSQQAMHLPFPPDAREVEFDATFDDVDYKSGSSIESLAEFYRLQMPARGWAEEQDAASHNRDELRLTFRHAEAKVAIELSRERDGSTDASLDCDELTWEGIDDPAGLAAAGVPQPRSHLFLQQDLPRPDDAFEISFASDECKFKSSLSAREAADYYLRQLAELGWTATRSRPLLTDNLCRLEFQQGPVSLDFTIFANKNPAGSRIGVSYENDSPEMTVAPLAAQVAGGAAPAAGGRAARRAESIDFSTNRGAVTVTYGGEKFVLNHLVAYQQDVYGRDRVLLQFCDRRIPYEKMQQGLSQDDEFAFYDLYQRGSPVTFGLFMSAERTSLSFSGPGVGIGGHEPEHLVMDVKIEAGRLIGTARMSQADEILSRDMQFEAQFDVAIMRPADWPPAADEEISLHKVTLSDEHGPPLPDNAAGVESQRSKYRHTVRATVPMTLPVTMAMYREVLTENGWHEDAEALKFEIDEFNLLFRGRGEESLLVTLRRDNPQTHLEVTLRSDAAAARDRLVPPPGKGRLILGNSHTAEVAITVADKRYAVEPGVGARSPTTAIAVTLAPGKHTVTIAIPGEDPKSEEVDLQAGTAWGVIALPTGGYLLNQVY